MILFISDLHLDQSRPATARAFRDFLRDRAAGAEALYILGDFFELWIGDDDDSPFVLKIQEWLYEFSHSGTPVYFMHGNRDFLIGEQFAERTGVHLLEDPTPLELNGQRALLMHGDTLCTRDRDYQAFRAQCRSAEWQADILGRSLDERRALGRQLREQSKTMGSRKAEDIMDVTQAEVERVMLEHGASTLIHGHTHRPDRHPFTLNGQPAERIVLGDWHDHGWALTYDGQFHLQSWPIAVDT